MVADFPRHTARLGDHFDPRVNMVAGPDSDQSQIGISGVWIDAIKALIPWRVNQVRIRHGDVHFLDFHADPKVDLELSIWRSMRKI